MAAFLKNIFVDDLCSIKIDPEGSLKEGPYYGWISHPSAGVNACVKGGEYTFGKDGEKQFCLVFPVVVNEERNSLDVREPPKKMCFEAKISTFADLAVQMTSNAPSVLVEEPSDGDAHPSPSPPASATASKNVDMQTK